MPHNPAETADGASYFTVSNVLTGLALGTALVGAVVIAAPHIVPALGVTDGNLVEAVGAAMHGEPTGLAGAVNGALGKIPLVGAKLAEGGWLNAVMGGSIGIGGSWLGHKLESREDGDGLSWGKLIRYGALATSALIALPTVLTALSTGILYAASALENAEIIAEQSANWTMAALNKTLGTVGGDYEHTLLGVGGITAAVPHFLSCGAPLLSACSALIMRESALNMPNQAEQPLLKILPANDPNRYLTQEQKTLVEAYNEAPAIKKPILQKWLRDQGYAPDFHGDGTMHLFAHAHKPTGRSI